MFPSSQNDMHKFCCDRSSCPKRLQQKEDSSLQTSSIEEIDKKPNRSWNKLNQETQISSSITTTTSEKNGMTASEYKNICSSYRKKPEHKNISSDMKLIYQQMENADIFKKKLKQLKYLNQFVSNCLQGKQIPSSSNKDKKQKFYIKKDQLSAERDTLYIEIPLEIHLKTYTKSSIAAIAQKQSLQSTVEAKDKCQNYCNTKSTQTSSLSLFEKGFMPSCWCSLQKSNECECKDLVITTFSTQCQNEYIKVVPKAEEKIIEESLPSPIISRQSLKDSVSKTTTCNCEREKLTEEQLKELMEKPNAKLISLICENKLKCICDLEKPMISAEPPKKLYRLAYPQHKDLDVCIKCRYDPSPLIDENNRVFCPGNCGCCLCAWKPPARASLEDILRHSKIKVCKCRNRTTVFEGISKYDSACSQVSYFDICPCREKAESKHLELYGYEMWDHNKNLRKNKKEKAILLEDVKEIQSSEKSSQAYFNRNNQNLNYCNNKFCPSNSSQTSQTKSQIYAVTINCPSIVKKTADLNRPQCCVKCKRLEQPSLNTITTSSKSRLYKTKCICKNLDITSSSSSSLSSEHFPVKLNIKKYNSLERKMPLAKIKHQSKVERAILPAPPPITTTREKLQPHLCNKHKLSTTKCEEYYSCSSDDSEDDISSAAKIFQKLPENLQCSRKHSKENKNHVILELLHEVVHLINKDNPIRDEALRITQVPPSSLDEKSSKIKAQGSEAKVEQKVSDLTPPPICPLPTLTWPPTCLCYAYGLASVQDRPFNLPLLRPYNLKAPAADGLQVPEPFIYEETDSFKDCSSGNKSLLTDDKMPDNLLCICSNISNICPKHGPLNKMLKQAKFPCPCAEKNKTNEEDIDEELHRRYVDKERLDSFDATKPSADGLLKYDNGEPKQTNDILLIDDHTSIAPNEPYASANLDHEIKVEEDVDEELHPRYVEKRSLASFDANEPSPDCLLEYDDEEPKQAEDIFQVDVDEEIQPIYTEQIPLDPNAGYEPCQDCLKEYDDEEPSWPNIPNNDGEIFETADVNDDKDLQSHIKPTEDQVETSEIMPPEASKTVEEAEKSSIELDKSSQDMNEVNETLPVAEDPEQSPYIVETLPSTGRNIYNFLPEIDRPMQDDPKQIIRYNDSEEEFDSNYHEDESEFLEDEYELAKEIRAESRKKKKRDVDEVPSESMALATIKQLEDVEGSPQEMKFFIDSLIMDLDAMEYARRKSQFEKNICQSKSGMCARKSFPVTITEVTDLGANSLYVKWIIHDCYGIEGYEIYTDGYLTNRYYNSKHEAAVITHVDITLPHKIALVAQSSVQDESIEFMCNIKKDKNKLKSLPWKTDVEKERKSFAALWTPSIFLYDPITCKATVTAPIMRDNF